MGKPFHASDTVVCTTKVIPVDKNQCGQVFVTIPLLFDRIH